MKENTTEHHSKELDDDKMIVCRDCHMTLEQYAAAADSIRIVKKGNQQVVVAKAPQIPAKPFGAVR